MFEWRLILKVVTLLLRIFLLECLFLPYATGDSDNEYSENERILTPMTQTQKVCHNGYESMKCLLVYVCVYTYILYILYIMYYVLRITYCVLHIIYVYYILYLYYIYISLCIICHYNYNY